MAHTPMFLPISIVICLACMPYEAISDKADLLLSKSGRVVKLDFGPIRERGSLPQEIRNSNLDSKETRVEGNGESVGCRVSRETTRLSSLFCRLSLVTLFRHSLLL